LARARLTAVVLDCGRDARRLKIVARGTVPGISPGMSPGNCTAV
jgi:hypothetical protein